MVLLPARLELERDSPDAASRRLETAVPTKLVEGGPGFELYEYIAVS
jgi:hypothetical protein